MIPEVPFKKHLIMGHTQSFARDTLGFVLECARNEMDIARARIAFKDFVILLDREAILHVLQKNHRNYIKSFAYNGLKDFLGNGLLTAEGEKWLQNRRSLQPSFHKSALAYVETTIKNTVSKKLNVLPTDQEIELQPLFMEWTRDILLASLFNLSSGEVTDLSEVHHHLWHLRNYANDRMKNPFRPPLSWPNRGNKKVRNAIGKLEQIILEMIDVSSKKANKTELLQTMLEQLKKSNWNDQQIFDEIITLFLAGQETTTNALIFLIHLLLEHPDIIERVEDTTDPLQWEHVVKESLRLYPPAWAISREAMEDDMLCGEKIQKGTTIFISIYALHRHPRYWDEPDKFVPDRFLENIDRKTYMPFGLGPRMCIGNHFAMMEIEIIARQLFSAFTIEKNKNDALDLITPMTMGPKNEYEVIFKKR